MNFILLTGAKMNNDVWINFATVILIEPLTDGSTKLFFNVAPNLLTKELFTIDVKEGAQVIIDKIKFGS